MKNKTLEIPFNFPSKKYGLNINNLQMANIVANSNYFKLYLFKMDGNQVVFLRNLIGLKLNKFNLN